MTALFLLAVVPLAGIVIYSYSSSLRAVREAVAVEAGTLTDEMESRMSRVQADIERRVRRLGVAPFRRMSMKSDQQSEWERQEVMSDVLFELGETAPLIYSFEFIPDELFKSGHGHEGGSVAPRALDTRPHPPRMTIKIHQVMETVAIRLQELQESVDLEMVGAQAEAGIEAAVASLEAIVGASEMRKGGPSVPNPPRFSSKSESAQETEYRVAEKHRIFRRSFPSVRPGGEVSGDDWQELELTDELREGLLSEPMIFTVREEGEVVGNVRTRISGAALLGRVLAQTRREQGEIPFALDQEGNLYALNKEDREALDDLAMPVGEEREGVPDGAQGDWVIVTSDEENTGLIFGIARPIRNSLREIRRTAATNFGYGLVLIGLAVIGIHPISSRITRDLRAVTEGAERIAKGDLDTRVPVTSRNEIGQLGHAFNSMASELKDHQSRLAEAERKRRDQEVQQRLLKAEFDRKSEELEDARQFQLSLLPRRLPQHPSFGLAVAMKTATEVGGDYYDFRLADEGRLTCAIGDATGHGMKAGTMVTVTKSLFSAYDPDTSLSDFLSKATHAIRRMDLGRMAMALQLARLDGSTLTLASAGMPPALLFRVSTHTVEEITLAGMPLGGLDFDYQEREIEIGPGDTLLLMTDGFPELPNAAGDPFGYPQAGAAFAKVAHKAPAEIIAGLEQIAEEWAGSEPPNDDLTFVVLRIS